MTKSTDVHDLLTAYKKQAEKYQRKVFTHQNNDSRKCNRRTRKVMRQRKRSVGKSNKLGFRRRAETTAALICAEMNFLGAGMSL